MLWLRTVQLAVKSLLLHPMRSLLTMLGIFIGVASVIWLLAIGAGISQKAQEQIEGLGADNIIVRSVKPPDDGTSTGFGPKPYGLTRAEQHRLENTIPHVKSVLPIRELPEKFSYPGNPFGEVIIGRLVGCTTEYAEVTRLEIDHGHFITPTELDAKAPHCVLAARLAERLFPYEDPVGKEIYLPDRQQYCTVVGVLKHRNATAAIGGSLAAQDFSLDVYIPITLMQQRIGDLDVKRTSGSFSASIFELSQVTLRIDDIKNVPRTAELVEATLAEKHRKTQDVATVVPLELLEQARTTRLMFMMFMGMMAAISLVVGGIGIMNIMLATVTERTREIGIRRALGARRSDIIRQFLVETVALSTAGGLLGILGGLLCPALINFFRWAIFQYSPDLKTTVPDVIREMQPIIVPISIPLAFFISVFVGVVFGIYPAFRAAHMDPIEALRHE